MHFGAFLGHVFSLPTEQAKAIVQVTLSFLGHQLPIFPEFPSQIGSGSQVLGYLGLGLGVRVPSGFGFALWVGFARMGVLMGNLGLSFPVLGVDGLDEFSEI